MSLGIVQDVPLLISDRHEFEQQILNTDKPIITVCVDQWGQEDCIKMAEIAGGEEELRRNPFICLYAEPISPGVHCREVAQKLVMGAKKVCLPFIHRVLWLEELLPATMAGVMVQGLCESLSGLSSASAPGKVLPSLWVEYILFLIWDLPSSPRGS